ncbi:hypothetical protein RSOLAG1IB_10332 [Rhizoctonia solani AG-1 IB]|uniref:Fe2OG dioxygenase domain-containing protein n=1 Tax=Thanatephorus cucumeris (strain AG1-IB / isolate 7/3/14) TaxID=1108050 RepID=A0A0B7G1A5_THACB|nr:hypothetical protein RSOLAG1IB_10332 [Rhizoctonia solani AG-1 IB]
MARKKTQKSDQTPGTKQAPVQSEIQWPTISVKEGLERHELIPNQIYVINDFLSQEECAKFSKLITGLPLAATPPPKRGEATRVNHRISLQSKNFAATIYHAILPHLPSLPCMEIRTTDAVTSGCNSNIRLYKYGPGEYFGPHYDESVRDRENGWWSEWTVLIYVTGQEDGVSGGETVFFNPAAGSKKNVEEIVPPLIRGSVLIHRHGRACMLHEGREVKSGTKLVLRTDIMFTKS